MEPRLRHRDIRSFDPSVVYYRLRQVDWKLSSRCWWYSLFVIKSHSYEPESAFGDKELPSSGKKGHHITSFCHSRKKKKCWFSFIDYCTKYVGNVRWCFSKTRVKTMLGKQQSLWDGYLFSCMNAQSRHTHGFAVNSSKSQSKKFKLRLRFGWLGWKICSPVFKKLYFMSRQVLSLAVSFSWTSMDGPNMQGDEKFSTQARN